MFPDSFRKFYAVLAIAVVMGFGAMAFVDTEVSATGLVVADAEPTEFPLAVFIFGVFVGIFVIGMVLTVLHYEHKR